MPDAVFKDFRFPGVELPGLEGVDHTVQHFAGKVGFDIGDECQSEHSLQEEFRVLSLRMKSITAKRIMQHPLRIRAVS